MHDTHKTKLDSLLTLEFQLFTDEQFKSEISAKKITRAIPAAKSFNLDRNFDTLHSAGTSELKLAA